MTREYRILPAGPCWETEDVLTKKRVLRSPTKRDLIYRTVELAKKEEKSKIVILNHDGSVEEEKVIDNNPEKKLKDFLSLYYTNLEQNYREAV
jgi:hypothetical protein